LTAASAAVLFLLDLWPQCNARYAVLARSAFSNITLLPPANKIRRVSRALSSEKTKKQQNLGA